MRILKKYPNRRLYDTEESVYVTLEDVRQMVLKNISIQIVDSKSGADLTRSVLLQIISEQEGEGHEPLLTNKVLQQLIRFYGNSMQGVLSRYIEQSVMIFLEQQELYQRRMRDVLNASPVKLVQRIADQNLSFWRSIMKGEAPREVMADALAEARAILDAPQQQSPASETSEASDGTPGTPPDSSEAPENKGPQGG